MPLVKVPIEVDITYVNKAWRSSVFKRKTPQPNYYVIGFHQRAFDDHRSRTFIETLDDNSPSTIKEIMTKHISPNSFLYAEKGVLPDIIKEIYDVHEFTINEVNNEVHVNNLKNAWKDLRRNVKEEHISVSRQHLQGYCNEVAWKINNKHLNNFERFQLALQGMEVKGERTTYKKLIEKKHRFKTP